MDFDTFVSNIEEFQARYSRDITQEKYFGYPLAPILEVEDHLQKKELPSVAYFSMEYGLAPSIYNSFQLSQPISRDNQFYKHSVVTNVQSKENHQEIHIDKMLDIPIYGGGLGVLAGDTLKTAADLKYPVIGLGVLWNKGYFKQKFWYKTGQLPNELRWDPNTYPGLVPLNDMVSIEIKEGLLHLRIWKYYVFSFDQSFCGPIILLDSDVDCNTPAFQRLTDQLYRSDDASWRIYQRAVLGIGGMKAIEQLQYKPDYYHLNEGHAALALVEEAVSHKRNKDHETNSHKHFVYTCHTPVSAGHDRFSVDDMKAYLKEEYVECALRLGKDKANPKLVNFTEMCLAQCDAVNSVSQKHNEVMHIQFPDYASQIQGITNGIHIHTWITDSFQELFDQYQNIFKDWRRVPENLVNVLMLKKDQEFRQRLAEAHQANKRKMLKIIKHWGLKEDVFTIGWARRMAGYKRPALVFHNVEALLKIANNVGRLQILLAGKAHPNDDIGSAHIKEILDHIKQLESHQDVVKVLILENYDTFFGKLLTGSVDVWLNNPLPPFEASGTSGMKAILNGVLQCTTLDGWVVEAKEDDIGWTFGYQHKGPKIGKESQQRLDADSQALYNCLSKAAGLYYQTFKGDDINTQSLWIDKMINCISRSGYFNTHRMLVQYQERMWNGLFEIEIKQN